MEHFNQKLYAKYQDKGVVIFGVNSWEENDPVGLMKKKRYSYGLLLKGEQIAEAYRVNQLACRLHYRSRWPSHLLS